MEVVLGEERARIRVKQRQMGHPEPCAWRGSCLARRKPCRRWQRLLVLQAGGARLGTVFRALWWPCPQKRPQSQGPSLAGVEPPCCGSRMSRRELSWPSG